MMPSSRRGLIFLACFARSSTSRRFVSRYQSYTERLQHMLTRLYVRRRSTILHFLLGFIAIWSVHSDVFVLW